MTLEPQAVSNQALPLLVDPNWIPKEPRHNPDDRDRTDQEKKLRIIVVDDESLIAETVAEILNGAGFEATAVFDGAAAIELAKTWQPQVVLSDVIMPGLNGVETGIKIREMIPRCEIVLFSGQAATVDLLEQARKQNHRFQILAKPISPERLISIIRASTEKPQ
jgi:CheY-like chemotaxis protein